jgi:PASTA domain
MTDVPNLLGFVFVLKSSSNKPDHTLTILSQNFTSAEFASIEGTWEGDGPSPKDITGDITTQLLIDPGPAFRAARHGNRIITVPPTPIWITFHWPNGMGGTNTLSGALAPNGTNIWQLDGTVVVTNSAGTVVPGGPGEVSGDGKRLITRVPPVYGEPANLATKEIIAADLSPYFSPDQKFTQNSWISGQSPQPNAMVAVGSTVELTVSNLNPP